MKMLWRREDNDVAIVVAWVPTNWTFGVWWDTQELFMAGVDLGPLQVGVTWKAWVRELDRLTHQTATELYAVQSQSHRN